MIETSIYNQEIVYGLLKDDSLKNQLINIPIIVLTGLNPEENKYLPFTLETIARQPGIIPRNVIVYYNSSFDSSISSLTNIFDFMSVDEIKDLNDINEIVSTTELLFPNAEAMIFVYKNVILSPDFLPFMGQTVNYLMDPKLNILAVSAWNDNGYENTSTIDNLIHKANISNYLPRFGVMIKKENVFQDLMWPFSIDSKKLHSYILFPDVSRVFYIVPENTETIEEFASKFFQQKRSIYL